MATETYDNNLLSVLCGQYATLVTSVHNITPTYEPDMGGLDKH